MAITEKSPTGAHEKISDLSGYIVNEALFEGQKKDMRKEAWARRHSFKAVYQDFRSTVGSCGGFYYMFGNVERDIPKLEILKAFKTLMAKEWNEPNDLARIMGMMRYVNGFHRENQRKPVHKRKKKILISDVKWRQIRELTKC